MFLPKPTSSAMDVGNDEIEPFIRTDHLRRDYAAKPTSSTTTIASDDILSFTQDEATSQSKKAHFDSSQFSASYDSRIDDIVDPSTQGSSGRPAPITEYGVGSSTHSTSARITSATSVSKDYNPYALVARQHQSSASSTSFAGKSTVTEVPFVRTSVDSGIRAPSPVDTAERERLKLAVDRANIELTRAKTLIECCMNLDETKAAADRMRTAFAALKEAQQALEDFERNSALVSAPIVLTPPQPPSESAFVPSTNPNPLRNPVSPSKPASTSSRPAATYDASELLDGLDEDDVMQVDEPVITTPASSFRPRLDNPLNPPAAPSRPSYDYDSYNTSTYPSYTDRPTTADFQSDFSRTPTVATTSSHMDYGTNSTASYSNKAPQSIPDVEVIPDDDEIDFEYLAQIETSASTVSTSRNATKASLHSNVSVCTSEFEPIPAVRGVNIEQYDPMTAQTCKWHSQSFPWSQEINELIQSFFGHHQWRTNQLAIVNAIMAKKDVFVTMYVFSALALSNFIIRHILTFCS